MTPTTSTLEPGTLAARFQALSDEKRVRILDLLRRGERCVCELTEAVGVGQSLLSFHLRALKDAGLVTDRREGRWAYYAVVPEALAELEAVLSVVRHDAEGASGEACCLPGCCG